MSPAKKNTAYLNFLATHDGIGIRPLEGILKNSDLKKLLVTLEKFGAKFTFRKNQSNKKSVYEANISLFDALSGTYKGKDTEKLLLDFYLVNTTISPGGNKVKATINNTEFIITEWAPYYLQGLPKGEIKIKLELINSEGKLVDSQFNPSERTVFLE